MAPIEEFFVPWIKGISMYISDHIELAWRQPELHRMMSNENPLPPSDKVMEAIIKYGKLGNRYMDQGLLVRSKIAELNGLSGPENVMVGNGSSEVFDMIFRSFVAPGEEVIQQAPCFGIYKLRCNILGGKLVSTKMVYKDKQILFDADAIIKAITPKTKMIVVTHPNNPTGNFMDEKDIRRIADQGKPFIVDEAYIEYAGLGASMVKLIKEYENVMVTRTLSKAYGLAGIRFGYVLSNKKVIEQMSATLIPWNVSTIAMWAALAAIEDQEGLQKRVEFNNRAVEYYEETLGSIPGVTVYHSWGNYILIDGTDTGKKGNDLIKYAEQHGFILRGQEDIFGRDGWWRVTIGTKEENELLVKLAREFYAKK
jgi:histidinol-phosphate aminotransferase